jgi:YD repeat-containing protein
VTTRNYDVCSDLPRHRNLELMRRRMTYDSFGRREKKRRNDDREQKRLLDSLDGDVDQRADRMGRSSGVETGEALWSGVGWRAM